MVRILLVAAISIVPLMAAGAESVAPFVGTLKPGADGQGVGLYYSCKTGGKSKSMLICDFTQVLLEADKTPKERADELDKAVAQAKSGEDKDLAKFFAGICPLLKEMTPDKLNEARQGDAGRELVARMQAYCASPGDKAMRMYLQQAQELESKDCKLIIHPYSLTFERKGEIFVSIDGPDPADDCGVIVTSSFLANGPFWNFQTRRIVTSRSGHLGASPIACKDLEEFTQTWVWNTDDAKGIVHRDCKTLQVK